MSDRQPDAASAPAAVLPPVRRAAASAKSEQRIRDILRVGREVFAERGYEHATTTEIASRLGVSEATVFTYFRGKRELCARVIGDWYDEIIATMTQGMPGEGTAQGRLRFFVRTHLRLFLVQGTGLCALVLSEGRSKGQVLGDSLVPLQRRYTAPLMDLMARGQAAGEIRSDMPLRLLRALVLGPMEHILWEAVAGLRATSEDAIDATAAALVDLLWPALAAPTVELAALRTLQSQVREALAASQR